MKADYFEGYRHLKLSRDDKGVLIAEIHSNGGAFIAHERCTAHTEFVDAFYRIGQDRAEQDCHRYRGRRQFPIGDVDWSLPSEMLADPGL